VNLFVFVFVSCFFFLFNVIAVVVVDKKKQKEDHFRSLLSLRPNSSMSSFDISSLSIRH